jgi:methylated-DNA-[protein]-cysteine S-methyltransferase
MIVARAPSEPQGPSLPAGPPELLLGVEADDVVRHGPRSVPHLRDACNHFVMRTPGGPAIDERLVVAVADGPWGPVRIAAGPRGVVAVEMLGSVDGFAAGLVRRGLGHGVELGDAPAGPARSHAVAARSRIVRSLAGEPVALDEVAVDLSDRSAWDRLVLGAVRAIPRGQVASYGEIARRIGRAGAARAVGGAVGRNPVGLLIPCHRVIAGDGSLGGYGVAAWGGLEAALDLKQALLALEGVRVRRRA